VPFHLALYLSTFFSFAKLLHKINPLDQGGWPEVNAPINDYDKYLDKIDFILISRLAMLLQRGNMKIIVSRYLETTLID
jgi:hypothetical protein